MDGGTEWFEVTEDIWRQPGVIPPKLRLLSDVHVPKAMVEEMRSVGIDVETAINLGLATLDDRDFLARTTSMGRVLLTMDRDFWDSHKFPLTKGGGVIYVDVAPGDVQNSLRAFGLLFGCFARSFPGNWTRGLRAKASLSHFVLRMAPTGQPVTYEMTLTGRRLFARQVEPPEAC